MASLGVCEPADNDVMVLVVDGSETTFTNNGAQLAWLLPTGTDDNISFTLCAFAFSRTTFCHTDDTVVVVTA